MPETTSARCNPDNMAACHGRPMCAPPWYVVFPRTEGSVSDDWSATIDGSRQAHGMILEPQGILFYPIMPLESCWCCDTVDGSRETDHNCCHSNGVNHPHASVRYSDDDSVCNLTLFALLRSWPSQQCHSYADWLRHIQRKPDYRASRRKAVVVTWRS